VALSAAEESAARGALTCWPAEGNRNRHALAAVQQLAKSVAVDTVLAAALLDAQGNNRGAVLALGANANHQDPAATGSPDKLLDAIRGPLATKLAATQRMQPGRLEAFLRRSTASLRGQRRPVVLAIILAITALMCLPLRYRVRATCQLQPVQRRLVAAPFDGPLEVSLVRPGDVVQQGELLARINPREIEYELAGVRADLSRAQQERIGLMAEHDTAGSTIAGLESERLRLETELLEYRRGNLEIRSPLAGVVVSGDHKQSEGTPLTRGETLFEIAPLGEMVVEIAVGESDFHHVRAGMPVDFYVHAIPGHRLAGRIDRIHPRAELRDHENVFIGEVRITDPDGVLRPGMHGRASITSDRHPLGWNLFHKAYFALRAAVGW
jgi:multidrug efflux pump subunit AcrA (membrane-fusion protein)